MDRAKVIALLAASVATGFTCYRSVADEHSADAVGNDDSVIYNAFLDRWTDHGKSHILVSNRAEAPTPDDLQQFTECASSDGQWVSSVTTENHLLDLGKLKYVRLVDPDKWKPQDPGELIRQGVKVDSAVKSGFAHGLLTISAIRFNAAHSIAALKYGFACGSLCGNGGVVVFNKIQSTWKESAKQCGGWIS